MSPRSSDDTCKDSYRGLEDGYDPCKDRYRWLEGGYRGLEDGYDKSGMAASMADLARNIRTMNTE